MTAELTAEQIVTKLLASNEIIKPNYVKLLKPKSSLDLGEYLLNKSYVADSEEDEDIVEPSKYAFIRGEWKI